MRAALRDIWLSLGYVIGISGFVPATLMAQEPLTVTPHTNDAHMSIDARGLYYRGGEIAGEVELQRSSDLSNWETERSLPANWLPYYSSGFSLPTYGGPNFFRLNFSSATAPVVTDQAAEFYGYNGAFRDALIEAPLPLPEDLLTADSPRKFKSAQEFAPESAAYFESLNSHFPLNLEETALLRKNGFVVSESLGSHSYADLFYKTWSSDAPVFLSADSVLHAWQFSCREALKSFEQEQLYPRLRSLIDTLRNKLITRTGQAYEDLDVYLSVAKSLLDAAQLSPPSTAEIVAAINGGNYAFVYPVLELTIEGKKFGLDFGAQDQELQTKNLDAFYMLLEGGGSTNLVASTIESNEIGLVERQGPRRQSATLTIARVWLIEQTDERFGFPTFVPLGSISGQSMFTGNGNEQKTNAILSAIAQQRIADITVFGDSPDGAEPYDFSQFIPRGHYAESVELERYFRAMMWLGRVDFRLTPGNGSLPPDQAKARSMRHLAAAVALAELVEATGYRNYWSQIESSIAELFGRPDFMTLGEFMDLVKAADFGNLREIDEAGLLELQGLLEDGTLGVQQISTHVYRAPKYQPLVTPRSMAMFGQRFTLDSWALDSVVFPKIVRDENGIPEPGDQLMRRIPSALDVAFSVFGNNSTTPVLSRRMSDPAGLSFRDGVPFQQNLAAVRSVIDRQPAEIWEETLYNRWLGTLRTLSTPLPPGVPDCMLTEAWAMKDVTTQLASWTQLRSMTILYVKQSVTENSLCNFPDIYVEPRPEFWQSLRNGARKASDSFRKLGASAAADHFIHFADTLSKIEGMLEKQLSDVELTDEEKQFVDRLIGEPHGGCFGPRLYDGWYPTLFLGDPSAAESTDARIVDFHTDLPCHLCNDPGAVVHAGTGGMNLLLMLARRQGVLTAFAGPVSSFHEVLEPSETRLTNEQWADRITAQEIAPPEWSLGYLVPSGRPVPTNPFQRR
ncbi:MAG: DUF3160 domain-containing protein [Verrucomicrobiae bacterium]|nr:DUF3160 domain-containing protein [Verrucomicrobiae bacterium]